ncbi:protein of unknown function [uncultured Woeseiaceae bacterium]|uniref:Uncharacterized protein n=1 Tax=uncultured Woeseiaceae bacterium TaxID=1983305 RepID=A0A7D9D1G4_9GAMM|nr:protein of unknown function [uncultured Woeseiaceae bacterium]
MSNELRDLIIETQANFKADAQKAKATFKSNSALQEGLRSEVSIRQHGLTVDEPEALGGADTGPVRHRDAISIKQCHTRPNRVCS